jgi:ADP-ribose pyrophosphatase YjhB (NUDIX family)
MKQIATQFLKYTFTAALSVIAAYQYASHEHRQYIKSEKDKPILTTAGIVHICPDNKIALIERGKATKGTAMFGGHIEAKEAPDDAFRRELKEELNISEVSSLTLIGVHGNYGRDPRQHSVEITYSCTTSQIPVASSDAKSVKLYDIKEVQNKISAEPKSFAFDHGQILQGYLRRLSDCDPCNKKCNTR